MRTKIVNIIMTPGISGERHIPFIPDAEILIEGKRIVYAGKRAEAPSFQADRVIDGKHCLAMPGMVNLHTHTAMTLMRSLGRDLDVNRWLREAIWPVEARLQDEWVRCGSDLGCLEMLRFGTTCFHDMYMHMDALAESVKENGMRATLGYGIIDFDGSCRDLEPGLEFMDRWKEKGEGRIRVDLAPHSEPTTTPELLLRVKQSSLDYDVPIHIHVSEARQDVLDCIERHEGMRPLEYLNSLGLLDRPVIAAHCVWLSDAEIELAAEKGVTLVHNPISNLKLASGIAPVAKMLSAGCRVALGTDGVASNDNLNLWEEMKMMPLLAKGSGLDATLVSPAKALEAATVAGAKALGYEDLGLLKEGYLADLILVNLNTPSCTPTSDMESSLIYSVQGSDVQLTMVDGKVLYEWGSYTTMDEASVLRNARIAGMELALRERDEFGFAEL